VHFAIIFPDEQFCTLVCRVGGQILGMLIPMLSKASTTTHGSLISQVAGGGVAGAVLTPIVGAIKNKSTA
jgi:hypothetical protein